LISRIQSVWERMVSSSEGFSMGLIGKRPGRGISGEKEGTKRLQWSHLPEGRINPMEQEGQRSLEEKIIFLSDEESIFN
jgi:hypothetical protein